MRPTHLPQYNRCTKSPQKWHYDICVVSYFSIHQFNKNNGKWTHLKNTHSHRTKAKMAPPENPWPSANSTVRRNAPVQATAPAPTNVTVSVMDMFIPAIPDAKPDDTERRFKYSTLTKMEGKPDYEQMCVVRKEIFRNSIAIRLIFVGGKHGHLSSVSNPTLNQTE